jgi:predicted nucleic acid-binding protein
MDTRIIVDTTIWIEFFRNPESAESNHLKDLLRQRRVVMAGMVLAEIVQGVKDPKEAKLVLASFAKLPYSEMTRDRWQQAGEISASLRKKGTTIPLSDLIIAAGALAEGCEIYTLDPHFKRIPGVKTHLP